MRGKAINSIIVVSAMCGGGKTQWAIQEINSHPERQYIFISPLLSEVNRIRIHTCYSDGRFRFFEPTYKMGRKLDDFNAMLCDGQDIASTHSTFANVNSETEEYLRNGKYHLVLDEVMDILTDFNKVCGEGQGVKAKDIQMLLEGGYIQADEYGRVSWIGRSYDGGKFTDVERLANRGNLIYLDGKLFIWEFPAEIFRLFESVTVLTYLFEGSLLKPFFEYHNIPYILKSVQKNEDGTYRLTKYADDSELRTKHRGLIRVDETPNINDYRDNSLSKNWFNGGKKRDSVLSRKRCTKISNDLYNYIHNIRKANASQIIWTCPKEYRQYIKAEGFTRTKGLTKEERMLSSSKRKKLIEKYSCWQPCNLRASNDYRDRNVVAYAVNMYLDPMYERYFCRKGIEVNEDAFALSNLIQFVWRSAIRDNKPISLYLPSPRMKRLFLEWLNGMDIGA